MREVHVAFENSPRTTAWHLVRAFERCGKEVIPMGAGHAHRPVREGAPVIWVESGRPTFPSPLFETVAPPSSAWIIDSHRYGPWRDRVGLLVGHVAYAQRPLDPGAEDDAWVPLAAPMDLARPELDLSAREFDIAFVGQAPADSLRRTVLESLESEFSVLRADDVTPAEMMAAYGRARAVLNIPLAGELNMRVFEAAASRSLILCSPTRDIERVLPSDGYLTVGSGDADAWAEGLRELLQTRTQSSADACYEAVRDAHSYDNRAALLIELARPADRSRHVRSYAAASIYVELGDTDAMRDLRLPTIALLAGRTLGRVARLARIVGRRLPRSLRKRLSPQF